MANGLWGVREGTQCLGEWRGSHWSMSQDVWWSLPFLVNIVVQFAFWVVTVSAALPDVDWQDQRKLSVSCNYNEHEALSTQLKLSWWLVSLIHLAVISCSLGTAGVKENRSQISPFHLHFYPTHPKIVVPLHRNLVDIYLFANNAAKCL